MKVFTSPKHYPYPEGLKPLDDKSEGANFTTAERERKLEMHGEYSSPRKNKDNNLHHMNPYQRAGQPINDRIRDMQQSGKDSGTENCQRRNSLAHLMHKTDQMYYRKDQTKIKMDEFAMEIDFKYGVPMIILDFIYAVTGYNIVEQIDKELNTSKYCDRMNPDNDAFLNYKLTLDLDFQELPFQIFDDFGELNLQQIQDETNLRLRLESQK